MINFLAATILIIFSIIDLQSLC